MKGYLGETILNVKNTKYSSYTSKNWALFWIERYGTIDGAHHKEWLIEEISKILHDTKIIIKLAKWDNGYTEERFVLDKPSKKYLDWIKKNQIEFDGIAP